MSMYEQCSCYLHPPPISGPWSYLAATVGAIHPSIGREWRRHRTKRRPPEQSGPALLLVREERGLEVKPPTPTDRRSVERSLIGRKDATPRNPKPEYWGSPFRRSMLCLRDPRIRKRRTWRHVILWWLKDNDQTLPGNPGWRPAKIALPCSQAESSTTRPPLACSGRV